MTKIAYWFPTFIWMALIFTLSSFSTVQTSEVHWQDFLLKKSAHFAEYFILAFLTSRSLKGTTQLSASSIFFLALAFAVLYAASDEFHQSFVPGREPNVRDVVIDSFGALAACLFAKRSSNKAPIHTTG